ncbi:MAG: CdaR family protein [bacterium]
MNPNKEKENEKNKRRENILYFFISILLGIAVWFYIAYYQNPEMSTSVYNIPIQLEGEAFLAENNLVLSSVNTRDLDIRFGGKWNTISTLTNSNVTARVDLSVIVTRYSGAPGTYPLAYTLDYDNVSVSNVTVEESDYPNVTVTVEKLVTAAVPVKGTFNGSVAEGYRAKPLTYSTDSITVSGPQSEVSQVAAAQVTLNRDTINRTASDEVPVVLVDAEGNELSLERVTLSQTAVIVTQPVDMLKTVSIVPSLSFGYSAREDNTIITIDPETITLSGPSETLEEINQIRLPSTIDLTLKPYTTATAEVQQIPLPDGTTLVSGESTVTVILRVPDVTTTRLSSSRLETRNVTEGYRARLITQSLDVTLRGTQTALGSITSEDILIIADLSEQNETTGVYVVSASIAIIGRSDIDAIGEYEVTVELYVPTEAELASEAAARTSRGTED